MKRQTCGTLCLVLVWAATAAAGDAAKKGGWSEQQIPKLPKTEKPVRLFNGEDLAGWKGQKDKYFSVENGEIVFDADDQRAAEPDQ